MKTNLKITGRVELGHEEITKAVVEYLAANNGYRVTSVVIYPKKITAVANVRGLVKSSDKILAPDFSPKEPGKRTKQKTYTKKNIGVFSTIRSYFNDELEKTKKPVIVHYDTLRKVIFDLHPNMTDFYLRQYLNDKRQLKGLVWNHVQNRITVGEVLRNVQGKK